MDFKELEHELVQDRVQLSDKPYISITKWNLFGWIPNTAQGTPCTMEFIITLIYQNIIDEKFISEKELRDVSYALYSYSFCKKKKCFTVMKIQREIKNIGVRLVPRFMKRNNDLVYCCYRTAKITLCPRLHLSTKLSFSVMVLILLSSHCAFPYNSAIYGCRYLKKNGHNLKCV